MMLALAACPRARETEAAEVGTPSADTAEQQRRVIAASVAGYVDALGANDPAAAVSWVVSTTFDFYDGLLALALTGKRSELEQRSVMEIVMILELRKRFTRSQLEQTNGRKLFEEAIAAGMQAGTLSLDDVWIDDSGTRAEVRNNGQTELWLVREQGRWLIDLPAMIVGLAPLVEAELTDEIAADGKLRVAFALLEQDSAQGLDIAILDGPLEARS
jgi:hypothetical protein